MVTDSLDIQAASNGWLNASDSALVQACRRGDESAWEALIWRYQRLVYAIPRRGGLTEDSAADVFQRVFSKLFESLHRIEQPERLGAWLITTAKRETWRLCRRERAVDSWPAPHRERDDNDNARIDEEDMPDAGPLPEEVVQALQQQHDVRRALGQMDGRCQKLLKLLFYQPEPPPYAEIAAALGASEGSIGPTRARCLQKLRRLLDESGWEHES
jgi:RNA polymerase sigma factor (sigma-70 family)